MAGERQESKRAGISDSRGLSVVPVTSGAIAEGVHRLGWEGRPSELPRLQAAASVGQPGLMKAYDELFRRRGTLAAQILLTHEDFAHPDRNRRWPEQRSSFPNSLEQKDDLRARQTQDGFFAVGHVGWSDRAIRDLQRPGAHRGAGGAGRAPRPRRAVDLDLGPVHGCGAGRSRVDVVVSRSAPGPRPASRC